MKLIAEMCQNHNGDFELLKKMVISAKNSGANYAKIQNLYSFELAQRVEFENQQPGRFELYRPYLAEFSRLQKLDLSEVQERQFVDFCIVNEIEPMTTVFTSYGALRAEQAGFKKIKLPSYQSTNFRLIEQVSKFSDSLYISTGATTEVEIAALAKFLSDSNLLVKTSLLHCRTEYPNRLDRVHMSRMMWLKNFANHVGFSDHSETYDDSDMPLSTMLIASKISIMLGADIVERHFSILKASKTKDGKVSIGPNEIKELARFNLLTKNEQKDELRSYGEVIDLAIDIGNSDFEPSTEEWFNRRYYKTRVTSEMSS